MRKTPRAGRRRSPRYRRLCAEPLETRQLLSITVNTLVDEADGSIVDGDVSLRDAIALAPSGETIDFSVNGTILLTLGELVIDKDLTIDGPGAELLTIDGVGNDPTPDDPFNFDGSRLFRVAGNPGESPVALKNLTLTGGRSSFSGGAVAAEHLFMYRCVVTGNYARGNTLGGGVYVTSSAGRVSIIQESVFANNYATGGGGGIGALSYAGGRIVIVESTFSGNSGGGLSLSTIDDGNIFASGLSIHDNDAYAGGGLSISTYNVPDGEPTPSIRVTHSMVFANQARYGGGITIDSRSGLLCMDEITVSGNTAVDGGGGIFFGPLVFGTVLVGNSTITRNVAGPNNTYSSSGGGIWHSARGEPLLYGTIVANNYQGDNLPDDILTSQEGYGFDPTSHHNLIGVDTGLTGITNGTNGNIIGTAAMPIDPMLGPLADNGGPTLTHAPLPGSPVIDSGDPAFVAPPYTDQRGYYRVVDGDGDMTPRIDIGAVEYGSVAPLPGDGNLDMTVDGLDYVLWAENFYNNPPADPPGAPLNGDFNDDGVVDGLDYVLWAIHFGETVATASVVEDAVVVDAALKTDVASTGDAAAGGSLPYQMAVADDGDVASAFDVVFAEMTMKKTMKHRRR